MGEAESATSLDFIDWKDSPANTSDLIMYEVDFVMDMTDSSGSLRMICKMDVIKSPRLQHNLHKHKSLG
jgi:hypothetical protein